MLTRPSTRMHGRPAQEGPPHTCRPHPDALLKALGDVGFCLRANRDGDSSRSARHAAPIGGPRHECYLWGPPGVGHDLSVALFTRCAVPGCPRLLCAVAAALCARAVVVCDLTARARHDCASACCDEIRSVAAVQLARRRSRITCSRSRRAAHTTRAGSSTPGRARLTRLIATARYRRGGAPLSLSAASIPSRRALI
jgi:hypothetical protein